jgi:hypothetical protein
MYFTYLIVLTADDTAESFPMQTKIRHQYATQARTEIDAAKAEKNPFRTETTFFLE